MLQQLLRFSVRHPRTIVTVVAAVTLCAALFIPGIELRLDGRSLIPRDHPSMLASDRAAEIFGLRDLVVLAVRNEDGGIYTPAGLQLLAEISDALARVDGVNPLTVASLATLPRVSINDDVIDLRPLLSPAAPHDAAVVEQVRRETETFALNNGVLVSRDNRAAAIYADVEADADRETVRRGVEALVKRHRRAPFQLAFSGTAMAQAEMGAAAARDLARLIPIVLLVTGVILTVAFRHPLPAIVTLTEVAISLVWTTGLMGARHEQVFVTTLALPVVLLVIGVSDDLYLLKRYFSAVRLGGGRPREDLLLESIQAVRTPLLLTSLTTMIGLLSLLATSIEPQRVFGLYGAVSVACSALFTFTLVPALLVLAPAPRMPGGIAPTPRAERQMMALLRLIGRAGSRRIVFGAAAIVIVAGALATRLHIEDSWIRNLPPQSPTVQGDAAINQWLAGTNTVEILFDSGRTDGFLEPEALAALGTIEQALLASPAVGAVQSVHSEVIRLTAALSGTSVADYRSGLASGGTLLTKREITQAVVLLDSLGRSPLADRLDREYRRARMTVFVRSANYSRIADVLAIVHASDPQFGAARIVPFGDGWIGHATIGLLVRGQVSSIGIAVLSNTAVLAILFRSFAAALVAIAPVAVGILVVFGGLAAAGVPLGTANSMFAAIALGVGADFSIHLTAACRQGVRCGLGPAAAVHDAVMTTGPAIATSAVALPAGFLVLLFSAVLPNRELGLLIAVSMVTCATMALVLVPALMLLVTSRPARREEPAVTRT